MALHNGHRNTVHNASAAVEAAGGSGGGGGDDGDGGGCGGGAVAAAGCSAMVARLPVRGAAKRFDASRRRRWPNRGARGGGEVSRTAAACGLAGRVGRCWRGWADEAELGRRARRCRRACSAVIESAATIVSRVQLFVL